jgi:hypothetical protein
MPSHRLVAASLVFVALSASAQVITSQYDNARTGANLHETALTRRNVNSGQFGKLFSLPVDGDVYAQPLYFPDLEIPGKGRHNVLFIATEHDSVYAFDAEGSPRASMWRVNFTNPSSGVLPLDPRHLQCPFINPEVGITSTPVIDPDARTLYVLARTESNGRYFQHLHALDLATGAERPNSPVEVRAPGFDPLLENPRAALLLASGSVYLSWASSCDVGAYHGWMIAYDALTLQQQAVFNTSPNSTQSGIWAADTGPAIDTNGDIFVATGNGKFDPATGDYGDTLLRLQLDRSHLVVHDYFTPSDQEKLNKEDNDLGSGGPLLLPDQPGAHPHLVLIAGKGAVLYSIDRDRMGKSQPAPGAQIDSVKLGGSILAAPAYWNGRVYVFADNDVLKAFTLENGRFQLASQGLGGPFNPGATPAISANGARDGIVWTVSGRTWQVFPEKLATLHAFDAADLSKELYNSAIVSDRDRAGISIRFAIPTIANGRVYIGARSEVDVYGLLNPAR